MEMFTIWRVYCTVLGSRKEVAPIYYTPFWNSLANWKEHYNFSREWDLVVGVGASFRIWAMEEEKKIKPMSEMPRKKNRLDRSVKLLVYPILLCCLLAQYYYYCVVVVFLSGARWITLNNRFSRL